MAAIGAPVFAVGQYSVTFDSVAVGLMQGEEGVPTLIPKTYAHEVNNTDAWGKMLIESFTLGADWQCQFTMMEYKAATLSVLWPFAAALGTLPGFGLAYTALAQVLVLTAVTGTPAATAGPVTITATLAILARNFTGKLMFGPMVRTIPVLLDLYPYVNSENNVHFINT